MEENSARTITSRNGVYTESLTLPIEDPCHLLPGSISEEEGFVLLHFDHFPHVRQGPFRDLDINFSLDLN
jgi:hypothetical protein